MLAEIIDYTDVWGNQEEGYEINMQRSLGVFYLTEDSKECLMDLLKSEGIMAEYVTPEQFELDMSGDMYYDVIDAETQKPLWGVNVQDDALEVR